MRFVGCTRRGDRALLVLIDWRPQGFKVGLPGPAREYKWELQDRRELKPESA